MNVPLIRTGLLTLMALGTTAAHAYGGGSGASGSTCEEPIFFDLNPAQNATVESLRQLAFVASSDTDPKTLQVKVNGVPAAFSVTEKPSGHYAVAVQLDPPGPTGKARINVFAKSKDPDCTKLFTYYINVE